MTSPVSRPCVTSPRTRASSSASEARPGRASATGGHKIGNAYLKWAFSEAAVLFIAKSEQGRTVLKRLERKYGKPKALSVLAHKLGRAVYYMLARRQAFDPQRFASA